IRPDEYVASVRVLLELRPDARYRVHHALALDDRRSLTIQAWEGEEGEGAFESPSAFVTSDGVRGIRRIDVYSPHQLDPARARYEKLRADPLRIPPNAATRTDDRNLGALVAGDWQAVAATCAPSLVFEDRRRLVRLTGDRDMSIETCKLAGGFGQR